MYYLKEAIGKKDKLDLDKIIESNVILGDLLKNIINETKEFSPETINLALQIKSISPKSYDLLFRNLLFPSVSYVDKKFKENISDIPKNLIDINSLCDIINQWKSKFNISKSQKTSACLAVDALYFKPDFSITIDNCISGMIFNDNDKVIFPDGSFQHLQNKPSSFKLFIELNWEKIAKAGFVFQIQPYNFNYKPFIVHIFPSTNGKASAEIVDLLFKIRAISKNRRIVIKSFAFDGDSSYRQLHLNYIKSYYKILITSNKFFDIKVNSMRVVSDYIHLIKRLRYRLLSSILHVGFTSDSEALIIEEIKEILDDMSEIVWCNDRYTKMHDKLPLELFKIENLLKLINENKFGPSAYWFPISISMIAIFNDDIEIKFRNFLLQCSLFFIIYYYDLWENTNMPLRQRKYGEVKEVILYTKEIMIEFSNTIYSNLQLMNSVKNFNFSSNGTGPLEHKFGFSRVKSLDINTISRFIQVISKFQAMPNDCEASKFVNIDEETNKIRSRINHFGTSIKSTEIYDKNEKCFYDDEIQYLPCVVAKAFLIKIGFTNFVLFKEKII